MFWGKNEKEKGLPELPPMKPFASFGTPKEEEIPKESEKPEEAEEELPKLPEKFRLPKMESVREITPEFTPRGTIEKSEDVYVKIDKFHSARKALNAAREKLKEIDETMRRIRETRLREEQELSFWEKEIGSIKTKVEDVTKNIFEKIE